MCIAVYQIYNRIDVTLNSRMLIMKTVNKYCATIIDLIDLQRKYITNIIHNLIVWYGLSNLFVFDILYVFVEFR